MSTTHRTVSRWKACRSACRGNALMEYVVPMSIILLSAGVLATMGGITDIIADYFMAASGHTTSDLSGGVFKTKPLASNVTGFTGNGMASFTNFGTLTDASGAAVGTPTGGVFYSGPVTRSGTRPASTSTEYLYP